MEATEELITALQLANSGTNIWLPITALTSVFGVVIMLLLYIWKTTQKASDKRHDDNEEMIKEMATTLNTVTKLLVKFETKQDIQSKDIDTLKVRIN